MNLRMNKTNPAEEDLKLLLEAMEKGVNGDFSAIDASAFHNPEIADKYNTVLDSLFKSNNIFVMRLNEAMAKIGDSSCVKEMIEQINSQTIAIGDMRDSSQELGESIENIVSSVQTIQETSHEALTASAESVSSMEETIRIVDASVKQIQAINSQINDFREKTAKITEIIDMVQKIAQKSGLLALNASIEAARAGEAGRGFAVVANQVKDLSANTTQSTTDVIQQVNEIRDGINELVASIETTTKQLEVGNNSVHQSVVEINRMNQHINNMSSAIDSIFDEVNTQSALTQNFVASIDYMADNYDTLSSECLTTGGHLYKISREIDGVRSDMARHNSNITTLDWITVFERDHLIFTWRVYNHLAGFEKLTIEQLNNPNGCKLGKWLNKQTDPRITGSVAFRQLVSYHEEIHKHACDSWYSKQSGNREEALQHFNLAYASLQKFFEALNKLRDVIRSTGDDQETPRKL